ncbi:peptidoglycan DD-metalloendopeptidase family protein [Virgibacillus sediminis]|uniref:Peptidoglycan DD-metalloendopeptidase family protein n=1 Tax=Virgibacillus sediminis TaxID=202260 RepID=A0ABV7A693_9BACI
MALRDLIVSVSANTSSLQDLNKHMDHMTGNTSNANKEMKNMEKRTSKVGKVMKGAAIGVGAVGTAAAGAGAGLFAMTKSATEGFDRIAKTAPKLGITTDAFQEMEYWAGQNGIASQTMERAVGRLNQRMGLAAEGNEKYASALTKLGVDMNAVKDGTVSTEDAMAQSIQTLSQMTSEQDKSALASELFGTKMARDLMPALKDGALTIEEAKEKAADLGIVIGEDTLSAAEKFQDSWDDISQSFTAVGQKILIQFMPIFQSMMDWFMAKMPQIQAIIQKSFDVIGSVFNTVTNWVQSLIASFREWYSSNESTMTGIWQTIQTTFGQVVSFLQESWANIQSFWEENGESIFQNAKNIFSSVRDTVMTAFNAVWTIIQEVLSMAVPFIQEKLGVIQKFWDENGSQIMDAVQNAFSFIQSVIQFVMPLVLGIIKMVWGNIQGVISGALDIIMGLVKTFSGLFTGDFSKMWEGIKQMFSGAIEFIWNFIQLTFFGRILKGAKAFVGAFKSGFSAMWTALKALFTGSISGLISGIRTGWTTISKATSKVFTGIWNFLKSIWAKVYAFIFTSVSGILGKVKDTWSTLKTATADAFKSVYNGIKDRFTDIVDAAKALPGRIGDGIGSMASKVKSGVTSVINTLARTLGKGVNGVIGGINTVLGWIGVKESNHIDLWDVPQWAQGTGNGSHPGGLAMVNDGIGSNAGQELIRTPDGRTGMFEGRNVIANLPKGTQVLSATDTRALLGSIPQYNSGTDDNSGFFGNVKNVATDLYDGAKNIGGKIKDMAVNAFDYIKNPGKLLNKALNALGISSPAGGSFIGDMARGAFNKVKTSAVDFVKNKLADLGGDGSGGFGFGGAFRKTSSYGFRINPVTGQPQLHAGDDYGAPVGTPIPAQAAGRVVQAGYHAIRGNYVRIKSGIMERIYQHNARNLVSVGDVVRKGQSIGTAGSTGRSTGPHLHYEVLRNGQNINPKGYANGTNGPLKRSEWAWVGERGPELMRLNRGTEIFSNRESKAMVSGGYTPRSTSSGGGNFAPEINITIEGNADEGTVDKLERMIDEKIEEMYATYNQRMLFNREG